MSSTTIPSIPIHQQTSQPITITTLIDSFKNSFSSKSIATNATTIFSTQQRPNQYPIESYSYQISDGGEGFIDAMSMALNIEPITHTIIGPLNTPITASYLYDPRQQLIILESAQGVGIQSVPRDCLDPFTISSYGVGLQLRHVLLTHQIPLDSQHISSHYQSNIQHTSNLDVNNDINMIDTTTTNLDINMNNQRRGIKTIILGLGGTASVDCGLGLLYGLLNIKCYKNNNNCEKNEKNVFGAEKQEYTLTNGPFDVCLGNITKMQFPTIPIISSTAQNNVQQEQLNNDNLINFQLLELLFNCNIILASDVINPLRGINGATYVFGPQKGLQLTQLEQYESSMVQFSTLLQQYCSAPINLHEQPGCGAAGGIGYALYCLFYYYLQVYEDYINNQSQQQLNYNTNTIQHKLQQLRTQIPFTNNINNNDTNNIITKKVTMQSGFELLYSYTNISKTILYNQGHHIIITGEGSFDSQSLNGKVIDRVCNIISKVHANSISIPIASSATNNIPMLHIPVIILCGHNGFDSIIQSTNPPLLHFIQQGVDQYNINGDNNDDEKIKLLRQLAEMNIVKIININDTKYHLNITNHDDISHLLQQHQISEQSINNNDITTLEYKLRNGLTNATKVLLFLQQLLYDTMNHNHNYDQSQQQQQYQQQEQHGIIQQETHPLLPFIIALQKI